MSTSARSHPIVDADAHWLEPVAVFLEFLRDIGGPAAVSQLKAYYEQVRHGHRWGAPSSAAAGARLNPSSIWPG